MHYDALSRDHGLPHDPFKALVAPRPIGWIGTVNRQGQRNLAPYSFFNAISDRPPMVVFSSGGLKDSLRNVLDTGEFTCSLATRALMDAMNLSSAPVKPGVDEFELAGLTAAPSRFIAAPRVAEAPAALECRLWQTMALPPHKPGAESSYTLVIGQVVGIYLNDDFVRDGRFDIAATEPLLRLGYMDYATVGPAQIFEMNRPLASADGLSAELPAAGWDGVYR
ncbi:flavin reductase family protein [Aquabacterium sp. OR-4]|uniref:flavin reductase family protein n=1 Tax=Aquabacterium sp. OR-4 TaxID=2978127 RepID=UPI0021B310E9|nr:flavin reductase family protein [Aquabacterium sp. OR-4]MDT7834631.1 flavin reductase family protein [Aquabacterium sp. OR-4]